MGWLAFGSVLYQDCLGSCRKCLSNPEFMGIRSTLYHNYADEIGTRPAEIATVWQLVDAALQAQLAQLVAQLNTLIPKAKSLALINANPARPGYGSLAAALGCRESDQIGSSIDLASSVKSFGPVSVMCQQSSRRIPNSPGI